MPRPKKCKRVCMVPKTNCFTPVGSSADLDEPLIMSIEEFETIRLIDGEGLSQEECAERMSVGRATIQRIYADARKKIAQFLLEEKALKIQGGDYRVCEEIHRCGTRCDCPRKGNHTS